MNFNNFQTFKTFNIFLFSFFCLLWLCVPLLTQAAILYLIPQSQTVYEGDNFIVEAHLDSEDKEVNAAQIKLVFPQNLLEVTDLGKGNSILSLWISEPVFSNEIGIIQFEGGMPAGFKGKGVIGRIFFKAKNTGLSQVNFSSESQVLLHDGKGTPAELSFLEGNYEIIIKPEIIPVVSSKSHPDQNKWYKKRTLHLHWDLVEGAQYSYILSRDPLAEPDETPDKPEGELIWMGDMEYKDLGDGIYYFSLKQKLPEQDWSERVILRAMIDATPPELFEPEIGQDSSMFEGKYFLSFATTDKMSGLDHYKILEERKGSFIDRLIQREQKEEWRVAKSPCLLEDQSLRSKISVKAIDKAGNERIAEITPPLKPFPYWIIILALIGIGVIWWLIRKFTKKKEK